MWPYLLPIAPSLEWNGGVMTDTSAWYEVKGVFTANGGEQFVTITNFSFNQDTDTIALFPPIPFNTLYDEGHFYLDDVSVYELPEVFAGDDTTIYAPNSTLSLGPLTTKPGITYSWSPSTGLNNPNIANPTATPTQTTTYILTVTDTSQYACSPQMYDTVTVTVIDTSFDTSEGILFVPTAFSPNGDNNNDILYVRSRYPIEKLEFKVFDRWGVEVFSTADPTKGWDGKYKDKALNNSVFFYYAKAVIRGREFSVKGNVTLIK
jgi:gliding motility-associated-like protein